MKKVSLVALLSILNPGVVFGYDYTITDSGMRSHSYSVQEISQSVYDYLDPVWNNSHPNVFKTVENGDTNYYKWTVPDLTQYQTSTGANIFSTTNHNKGSVDLLTLNSNNSNVITKSYFYNQLTATDNSVTNGNDGNINQISDDFIYNTSGAIRNNSSCSDYPCTSTAIIGTIDSNFIGNKDVTAGGAIINGINDMMYSTTNSLINSITGNFIGNSIGEDPKNWYEEGYGTLGSIYGGAIYNNGSIGTITSDFIGNFINTNSSSLSAGGAIYNRGIIDSITGNFIGNHATSSDSSAFYILGGAIFNEDSGSRINSIHGDFIGNYASSYGGAISNGNFYSSSSTIGEIVGDFVGNHASNYGGAIYNTGTINSVSGNFIGNYTNNVGGAIYNSGLLTLNNDVIFSGNSASGSSGAIFNSGSNAQLNMNVDDDSEIRFNTQSDDIYNAARINITGTGTGPGHVYLQNVSGGGNFMLTNADVQVADGRFFYQKNLYIDADSTLSLNNVTTNVSNDITNNGVLNLNGGTFAGNSISGTGNIIINGDVESTINIEQSAIINENASLAASPDNIANASITNNGMIWLKGGVLNSNLSSFIGNVGTGDNNVNGLMTDAVYIDRDIVNKGILNITGGEITHNITGPDGDILIRGDVIASTTISQTLHIAKDCSLIMSPNNIQSDNVYNNGILTLTGGTLNTDIQSGGYLNYDYTPNGWTGYCYECEGNLVVDGDIISNNKIVQPITINNGRTLTISGDNLMLYGAYDYYYGGNNPDDSYSDITNNGTLNITDGVLRNNVIGGQTVIANGATIASNQVSDIEMNGTWDIGENNNVHAGNAVINGAVDITVNNLVKDSNDYTGGKLTADSITLGENSKLRVVVSDNSLRKNESTGNLKLIESDSWTGNWFNAFSQNSQYDMTYDENTHSVQLTRVKSASDIVAQMGGSQNVYVVIIVWDQASVGGNPFIQQIIDQLNYAAQYDGNGLIQLLSSIAPTDSSFISGTSSAVNNAINNQISDRLASRGRNGGDMFSGVSIWGQGLYNYSSQSGGTKFSGNTFGFSLGADKKFGDNVILGLGYSLSQTSAESGNRDIDATGHTVFAYGEYRPHSTTVDKQGNIKTLSSWYMDGTLSYGITNYEDNAGYGITSDYYTHTLGINGDVGYNITDSVDLFVGARYLNISQDDYTDNLNQRVSVKNDNILTARFGSKYTGNYSRFAPTAHLELLYDIISSDRVALVNTDQSSYQITGDALNPFGIQTGFGFISNVYNWNFSLNYDLEWRPEFISHTARVKAKYTF